MKLQELKQIYESQFLTDHDEIENFLVGELEIHDFNIAENGIVNVNDYVRIVDNNYFKTYKSLPIQFGTIGDTFLFRNNYIDTLEGFPHTINGQLMIEDTNIQSLEFMPSIINGNVFIVNNHKLTSLEGISELIVEMKGSLWISSTFAEGFLEMMLINGITGVVQIGGNWDLRKEKATDIIAACISGGKTIYDAQALLVEADLEEYAQV